MMKKSCKKVVPFWVLILVTVCFYYVHANAAEIGGGGGGGGGRGGFDEEKEEGVPVTAVDAPLVKKDERRSIVSTEFGQISAVKIRDGRKGVGSYHLQFITLEPNALLLPLLLHSDMLFFVNTGSARLSYLDPEGDEDGLQHIDLRRGDVYRLQAGTFFFIQSSLETERQKFRIYAIFTNPKENLQEEPSIRFGAYSSVRDLLLGFNNRLLQAAFNVPEDVIEELKSAQPQQLIVHGVQKSKKTLWEVEAQFMRSLLGSRNYGMFDFNNKGKKTNVFNILKAKRDVENCNGWSLSVTKKQLKALKHSDMGVFMVNLTTGAMMGPHWNPRATEIGVVLQGRGMIRIACSSNTSETGCKNMRFRVEEGDVFAVPRFHPMAQISFNNGSFIFMGFTSASRNNHPQFLAGKRSVLQALDKLVLAASFQVSNETIGRLLAPQKESIILECTSCAEIEEALMEEEIEREKEEARKREEEEARKREEEKRREEEEARKREEEEAKRREEEKKRREEEEEEEARRREEEEAARKREEEEAKRREEEKKRREEEEEEEARRKEKEEEARRKEEARRREEEEARRREEEEAARRREEEEEAARREEERRRREEEAARRQEEEEARQQEEERERRQEEEAARREDERRRREAEQEEEAAREQEEERERQEEEEAARKEERRRRREAEQEEEAAREQEEERERQEEEEAARREERRRRREAEQEEEEKERGQEEEGQQEGDEGEAGQREQEEEGEEAAARREDEERQRRAAEEEAEAREREGGQEEQEGGGSEGEGRKTLRKMWRVQKA